MNRHKLLHQLISFGSLLVFLVGCSAPATPSPSPTPVPPTATPTLIPPTATETSIPPTATLTSIPPTATSASLFDAEVGHWEGEPSVTFDITDDGSIHNFSMAVPFHSIGTCTITADEVKIEADGTFVISESIELTDTLRAIIEFNALGGIPTPAVTQSASGDMIDAKRIDGKFSSATALTGTYTITICEDQFGQSGGATPTWSAEWKSP